MASQPPSAPPRWISFVTVILAIVGSTALVGGGLLTIGAWRGDIEAHFSTLDKRMDKAEDNQRTYIPVLLGLTKDVSYLADRARREDDRLDRERR